MASRMFRVLTLSLLGTLAPGALLGQAQAAGDPGRYDISGRLAGLRAGPPKEPWSFAVLGDSRGGMNVLSAALRRIDRLKPAFSIFTGDMVGTSTQPQWQEVRETLDTSMGDVPVLPVVGNHETYGEGIKPFLAIFGNPSPNPAGPIDYAFDHGGARFVLMDNSVVDKGRSPPEGFTAEQLAWLDRQLAGAGSLRFVAAHKPPRTPRWEHAFGGNSRAFMATLAKHRVTAAFFGHIHAYDRHVADGVDYIVTGGAGAPLYHWEGHPDAGNTALFESSKGVKAHNFVIVTVNGGRASFRTYTDHDKLARLRPARSAGFPIAPEDFEPWEDGAFANGARAADRERRPVGAGKP